MLVQHRQVGVFEDDVAGRIAFGDLVRNLGVQVVLRVFGFPVAERHPKVMHDGPVGIDSRLQLGLEFVFLEQKQTFRSCPAPQHAADGRTNRSEEHTSELKSLMRSSYAILRWKKK